MTDFSSLFQRHKNLSEEAQRKAGQAIKGTMQPEHYAFLTLITGLIESKQISVFEPSTFFKREHYDRLDQTAKARVDLATVNIADQLRQVYDFFKSKRTPDESPHLEIQINHLFLMKKRIEDRYGDVYKF